MKKYLKRNFLDEMYDLKKDDFVFDISKEMANQNMQLALLDSLEKLLEKIKQVIPDKTVQDEVVELLEKYEQEVENEDDFWCKMFYKLGAYDGIKMDNVVQNDIEEEKSKENKLDVEKTVFFDECSDEFCDYLNNNKSKMLQENEEYKELEIKKELIKEENPNVRTLLEDREVVVLSDVDVNAVLDILEIEKQIDTIKTIEYFKLGGREMLLFLKQMRLL